MELLRWRRAAHTTTSNRFSNARKSACVPGSNGNRTGIGPIPTERRRGRGGRKPTALRPTPDRASGSSRSQAKHGSSRGPAPAETTSYDPYGTRPRGFDAAFRFRRDAVQERRRPGQLPTFRAATVRTRSVVRALHDAACVHERRRRGRRRAIVDAADLRRGQAAVRRGRQPALVRDTAQAQRNAL